MSLLRHIIAALLLAITPGVAAQPVTRQYIAAVPERAGGIYYAYPGTVDPVPEAPAGYRPVYISHYGRHGSRWVLNELMYPTMTNILERERLAGNLTPVGYEVEKAVKAGAQHTEGHYGELSPLGEQQHKAIARRMYSQFTPLFDSVVEARSSVEPRCIISMAAFSEQLKELNPRLQVRRHATPGDMDIIAPKTPEASALGHDTARWQREFAPVRDSLTTSLATASRIFINPATVDDLPEFMRFLSDIALSVQDVSGLDINLLPLFTDEDLYNQWLSSNYMMYVRHANSTAGNALGPQAARSTLTDIISRADLALDGEGVPVDLRFGHDTALIRLLALAGIGIEGFPAHPAGGSGIDDTDPARVATIWQTYTLSPMAANLQLIFYRNDDGDVIVAPRLNERQAVIYGLDQLPGHPGWYSWPALRSLWLVTCEFIRTSQ